MYRLYRQKGVDDYVAEQPVQGVSIRDPCTGVPLSAYPPLFPVPLGIRTFRAISLREGRGTKPFVPLAIEKILTLGVSVVCKHFRGCFAKSTPRRAPRTLRGKFATLTPGCCSFHGGCLWMEREAASPGAAFFISVMEG